MDTRIQAVLDAIRDALDGTDATPTETLFALAVYLRESAGGSPGRDGYLMRDAADSLATAGAERALLRKGG